MGTILFRKTADLGKEMKYQCKCGKQGWVDMGKYADNRYPCRECYDKEKENEKKEFQKAGSSR